MVVDCDEVDEEGGAADQEGHQKRGDLKTKRSVCILQFKNAKIIFSTDALALNLFTKI